MKFAVGPTDAHGKSRLSPLLSDFERSSYMRAPSWLKQDRQGTVVTIEMEVKNLKDLERMERTMERLAQHLEKAANASERVADSLERAKSSFA